MDYLLEDFLGLGNTKPIKECFRYSLVDNKFEKFGIFKFLNHQYDYEFKPFKNLNTKNKEVFAIDNSDFYSDYFSGDIISIFHTHTTDSSELSSIDLEISESLGLPSYVISSVSKSQNIYYPRSYKPRGLYGRVFIPFFQDCISFVKDFYQLHLNITFNDISNWAREKQNSNLKLINQIKNYFNEIDIKNITYGDLIVFKPSISPFMHLAVFNKDNRYSHHPIGLVPKDELFTEESLNKVYKVYRYKDL